MNSIFIPFLMQLLLQAPALLACVAGIVVALVFWQRCPRSAMFALTGMALLLVATLAQQFLSFYIITLVRQGHWGMQQIGWLVGVNTIIWSVIRAAAYGLLLTAVFMNRKAIGN